MRDIGKNIKIIRQAKDMTQEALAEALFVTRQTVSNYENGRSRPDLDMLLKIAEVLETDVNTILYGPPVPQSKKDSYKWLILSASILVVVTVLYVVLNILFPKGTVFGYQHSIRIAVQLAVLPAVMFLLGWVLMHCLSLFSSLRQLHTKKIKVLRILALILLGLLIAIPIPIIIYSTIAGYHSYMYHSVSMSFPSIPVYREALYVILFVISHIPFVYTILGSLFWLLGLPSVERKTEDTTTTVP